MKQIIATFIGKDSAGFRNGNIYILNISKQGDMTRVEDSRSKNVYCFYGSVVAFMTNWDFVRNVTL